MKAYLALRQPVAVLVLLCLFLSLTGVQAQMKVGLPSGSPDPSAALDVSGGPYSSGSQFRGIAPPKVALSQTSSATPITNPVTGLLIFNTAKTGDVSPGYYYWEGNRWARLNTSNTGGARVATLGAGQYIPAYKLSEISSLTTTSDNIFFVEPGREGLFSYDSNDSTTPGDSAMVLILPGSKRYKRVIEDVVNLKWFGAKGDGITDDSKSVKKAVDYVSKAVYPGPNNHMLRKTPGNPGTLLVPVGTYKIANVTINGSILIKGQGGGTYAKSYFLVDWNHSGFLLGPDADGASNSTVFEDIGFNSSQPIDQHSIPVPADPSVAHVKSLTGISSNSIYYRHCWFQTIENCGIWSTQGGDIQITDCTFDVANFDAIRLGNVQDSRIVNCMFYNVSENCIRINNVAQGLVIANNVAILNDQKLGIPSATFVNSATATTLENIVIQGNETRHMPKFCFLETTAKNITITGNTTSDMSGYFLWLSGGGVVNNIIVTSNVASTTTTWGTAPITSIDCGIQNSIITGNTFSAGATTPLTPLGLDLRDQYNRIGNNTIDRNVFNNFHGKDNLRDPFANGKGVATPIDTTISTSGWTTTVYNELYAPNTLSAGKTYLLKLKIGKSSVDAVTALYCVPIEITYAGQTQPGDLTPLNVAAYSGTRTAFKVRLKTLSGGGGTYGIEATINDTALVGGTFTYSLTPLL